MGRRRWREINSLADTLPLSEVDVLLRPHLTTEQRRHRMRMAVHEAAHYVVGVRLGVAPLRVSIRIPGRTPRILFGPRGVDGEVLVSGYRGWDDAVIAAAGALADLAATFDDPKESWKRVAADDVREFDGWAVRHKLSSTEAGSILDQVVATIVRNWGVIDASAAYLLERGDHNGTVSIAHCGELTRLIRNAPNAGRGTFFSIPEPFWVKSLDCETFAGDCKWMDKYDAVLSSLSLGHGGSGESFPDI